MTREVDLARVPAAELAGLEILPAGAVDLRRDLYAFVEYLRTHELQRTVRGNQISKGDAKRLGKILSWRGEAAAVERDGCGVWSNYVSWLARHLKLVSFDSEGEYRGYTSTTESFIYNVVKIEEGAWKAYLAVSPRAKERLLLGALIDTTESEFFHEATLVPGPAFDRSGSGVGPAGRMKLQGIRRALLDFLTHLQPGVWYDTGSLVEAVRARYPTLILDPAKCEPDYESRRAVDQWERETSHQKDPPTRPRPALKLEDIYSNFRETDPARSWRDPLRQTQITARSDEAFRRVEGRYLEFFLREIPYLAGFVGLAYRPESDRTGLQVEPPLGRLRGFCLSPRLFQVLADDPALDQVKVTVLPNFEVLVETLSYPETTLAALAPYAVPLATDGPLHRLRIDRKRVIEAAAHGEAQGAAAIAALASQPLPENVAAELEAWSGRGQQVTIYEGLALVEFKGGPTSRAAVLTDLADLVADDRLTDFAIARDPGRVASHMEEREHVPVVVTHPETRLQVERSIVRKEPSPGKPPAARARPAGRRPGTPRPKEVQLAAEDLVGYRCAEKSLLAELAEALAGQAETVAVVDGGRLLILSAAALPRLRAVLRRLSDRFDVELS